jgi:hypothetical protein
MTRTGAAFWGPEQGGGAKSSSNLADHARGARPGNGRLVRRQGDGKAARRAAMRFPSNRFSTNPSWSPVTDAMPQEMR